MLRTHYIDHAMADNTKEQPPEEESLDLDKQEGITPEPIPEPITFLNLHNGLTFSCVDGLNIDPKAVYAIKITAGELRANDFKSKWEKDQDQNREHPPIDPQYPQQTCSKRGVSISSTEEADKLKEVFQDLWPLNPKHYNRIALFTFGGRCGCVKPTKSKRNDYHCDFYKSDQFDFTHVSVVEIKPLHP